MKEILKSKTVIGFVIFILGITYINSVQVRMIENDVVKSNHDTVIMNTK